MGKNLVVANWKEHFTVDKASEWLEKFKFSINNQQLAINNVIICPSLVLLPMMAYEVSKLEGVKLGAQDVSKFAEGPYTGEVSAKQLADFVSYVIVGHSERRRYFHETNADVAKKSSLASKNDLIPIVCVSSLEEVMGSGKSEKTVFAYEPLEAISTAGQYHPDDPEHANSMAKKIKDKVGRNVRVLYGGSVNSKNVNAFVRQPDIDGVLVGQASLDPQEFVEVIRKISPDI